MRFALLVLLSGCIGTNSPPRLLTVNGIELDDLYEMPLPPALAYTPGEELVIELEIRDPQGQAVKSWWPRAPAGWDADPDTHIAVWEVPDDYEDVPNGVLILEDQHPSYPRAVQYYLPLWTDRAF